MILCFGNRRYYHKTKPKPYSDLGFIFGNRCYGQRRTRTDTLARMILSQLRLPIPPVALIYSLLIVAHGWVI